MTKLRPKVINNVQINGNAYFSLIKSYVDAINSGAVPNIENAW